MTRSLICLLCVMVAVPLEAQATKKYLIPGGDPQDSTRQPIPGVEEVVVSYNDICDPAWGTGTPSKRVSGCYQRGVALIRNKQTRKLVAVFGCGNEGSLPHIVEGKVVLPETLLVLGIQGRKGDKGDKGDDGKDQTDGRPLRDTGTPLRQGTRADAPQEAPNTPLASTLTEESRLRVLTELALLTAKPPFIQDNPVCGGWCWTRRGMIIVGLVGAGLAITNNWPSGEVKKNGGTTTPASLEITVP